MAEALSENESNEVDVDEQLPCSSFFKTYSEFRSSRLVFSKEEDQKIIDWILKHQSFRLLKGNVIWKRMACTFLQSGSGRTWESLKERFLNHISCNLNQYKLIQRPDIWRIEDALGILDAKNLLCDTDMEDEEDVVDNVRSKVLKKRRSHDPSIDQSKTDEGNIGSNLFSDKRRRKQSKIPADSFDSSKVSIKQRPM